MNWARQRRVKARWITGVADDPDLLFLPLGSRLSAGQRPRQPEVWENAAVEAGHRADPVTGESKNEQAGAVPYAVRGAQVGPERRLTVGPCGHQIEPAARTEN